MRAKGGHTKQFVKAEGLFVKAEGLINENRGGPVSVTRMHARVTKI